MATEKKQAKKEIQWKAAEYEHFEKDPLWYVGLVVGAIILLLVALWQKNFFFAVFIIIATALVSFFGRRKPRVVEFLIDEKGIHIGNTVHEYDQIESFSIIQRPGYLDELIITKKAALNPHVRIPIDSHLAETAKEFLKERLTEVEHQHSVIDAIADRLGF